MPHPNPQIIKRNLIITIFGIIIICSFNCILKQRQEIQGLGKINKEFKNNIITSNSKIDSLNDDISKLTKVNKILQNELNIKKYEEQIFFDIPLSLDQQFYIYQICKEYNINYKMYLGTIKLESDFDVNCDTPNYNDAGIVISRDRGISQINSKYEHWYAELAGLKEWNIFNFEDGVRMGVAGLAYYQNYWINQGVNNEIELQIRTLNSYNMGKPGFEEFEKTAGIITRSYDRVIFNNIDKLN